MPKKVVEEKVDYGELSVNVDDTIEPTTMTEVKPKTNSKLNFKEAMESPKSHDDSIVNVLRNERVIVRHIPKESGMITNPKHVLYGGMAENAVRIFVVPRLRSGAFVNVLTDEEKACLEEVMGLEYNALSTLRKKDNFWDDSNENGIARVRLTKGDNYFDLSNPTDYIKYKILLANKDQIAPSLQALQDAPKATYQFVVINEGEESKHAKDNMSTTMKCYKEYGKVEDDVDTLRVIIETLDGRPTAPNQKLEFLQNKINTLIQSNSKMFLRVITDPYLSTKVLIKQATEAGIIAVRGNYLYLREDNTPLCEQNEEPTLNIAARFLNAPKHQDLLFAIQAKLKN